MLTDLDLHQVTVVCNDRGGARFVIGPVGSDRVANWVLVSCEAFDSQAPGGAGPTAVQRFVTTNT
ncbi:MAG: hypothetical protein OXG55_03040 [bacterium]|nr:hypothetical protein [bacterium]